MNDKIIEFYIQVADELWDGQDWCVGGIDDPLRRFAALVAAAEREACVNILAGKITRHEQFAKEYALRGEYNGVDAILSTMWKLSECADAIRARGEE